MTRKYIQITTLLTLVMVFSLGTAQARGKYPGPGQFKSQRGQARMMAKQLRKAGLPMNVVLAPLRIVRSGHKINKVKSGQLKLQENGVLPTKGTWTMSATKGQLAYSQKLSNTAGNKSASYSYTAPAGKGKVGVSESITLRADQVHHRTWKTGNSGTKVQVDRLVYPGQGGDVLVQTTRTTTKKDGTTRSSTSYKGVSQVGKLGEISYTLSKDQFSVKRQRTPHVFSGFGLGTTSR